MWPTPPFFQATAAPSDGHGENCRVELVKGRTVEAKLLRFDPGADSIDIAHEDRGRRHRISLELVRSIRLTAPLSLIRDVQALGKVGTVATHAVDERTFSIRYRDGKTFAGTTCGFVREKAGLFLYLREGDGPEAVRCFIPAQQFDDVQIGPLLGETLTRSHAVSSTHVAEALQQQAGLRQEKLGKLLADRGVVSQEELKRTLLSQAHRPTMKLGELLLEAGLISREQLDAALALQTDNRGRRLGDILVDMGVVTERLVQMALSEKLGIPFVNLREFRIDPLALQAIDASFADRNQVLPLLFMGESLVVAVENPLAMGFAQQLDFISQRTIVPVIANPDDLRVRIAKEYASLELTDSLAGTAAAARMSEAARVGDVTHIRVGDLASELHRITPQALQEEVKDGDSNARVNDNALVRLINKIIIEAHTQGASDIHIECNAGKAKTRIRFRKDGELEDYLEIQPAYRSALVSRIKIMANLDISERRHAQDGKIAFARFGPLPIELRVAVVPTANNLEDVVLRILGGVKQLALDKLGLLARDMAELVKMATRSYGLILVVGPTGSGKTTTLHSVLHTINRPDLKIWTAEDPIEITQAGLRQIQINSRIDWTFAAAMRSLLRADPDVIMVGEMRDVETTKIAIEASLTGHLVFSTLHTNSAAESIVRLLELGMDPFNFADALIGILAQRLARVLCRHCRKSRIASDAEISALAHEYCIETALDPAAVVAQWHAAYARDGQVVLHEAVGCDKCKGGYKGRIGVYELLVATPQIKNLIRARGSAPAVVLAAQQSGMLLLRQDAIEKVFIGLLDLPSARAAFT